MTSLQPHAAPPNWESVEDLAPLSTQLLTPVLAEAFEIPVPSQQGGPVGAARANTDASLQVQRPNFTPRPMPAVAAQPMLYPGYFPATAQATLPPQPSGNLQLESQQPQLMPGLSQQLQKLGVQQPHLKAEEKSMQPGAALGGGSGLQYTSWMDTSATSSRLQLPQSGQKHPSDTNMGSDPENGDDHQTRALKRPRLVWTAQLHQRFVDAVKQLGLKNAVPKTIMQLMNVDGLTRENVASHLQKYRLQLRKEEGRTGDEHDKSSEEEAVGDAEVPQG